jgi:outer membrane protein assembly factor BamB
MLVALNQTSGQTLWTQDVPFGGPAAITADGVFVGDGCQTSRLDPATGAVWWTSGSPCLDQGTWTPVVSAGEIYAAPSGRRLDADGGAQVGNLATDAPPAIGPELGFFRQGNSLSGVSLLDGGTLWTYTADAGLVGPPLGVNEFAIIASPSGRVIALDGRTGAEAWTQDLGAPISDYQPGGWGQAPSFGLAAGDGLLVVPASFTLTAFTLSSSP